MGDGKGEDTDSYLCLRLKFSVEIFSVSDASCVQIRWRTFYLLVINDATTIKMDYSHLWLQETDWHSAASLDLSYTHNKVMFPVGCSYWWLCKLERGCSPISTREGTPQMGDLGFMIPNWPDQTCLGRVPESKMLPAQPSASLPPLQLSELQVSLIALLTFSGSFTM